MTYAQLIKHYGSARNVAKALGITTQCVYHWQRSFPIKSQALVFLASKGALQIDGAAKSKRAAK